ncbi:N-acetylglucosamine kinase [Microbacterium tumbae]
MIAIGVDVGGSGIRAQMSDADGTRSSRLVVALPREQGRIAVDALADSIVRCIHGIEEPAGGVAVVCIGTSGLPDLLDDPERLAATVGMRLGARQVILANDAVTAHIGALAYAPGIVIAAGTGAIALGTDLDRVWNRSDGWGLLLGDEGSGAWIGRRGLVAALRAADGRARGSTALLLRMRERIGDPAELVDAVYGSPTPAYVFGGFAPHVADVAREGDAVALRIWNDAAAHLASAALAAAEGVDPLFSWSGRLFDAGDLLIAPLRRAILAAHPGARLIVPDGSSSDGALLLARDPRADRIVRRSPLVAAYDMG